MDRSRDIKEAERQKGRHIHRQMLESQRGAERGTERETETQRQRGKKNRLRARQWRVRLRDGGKHE